MQAAAHICAQLLLGHMTGNNSQVITMRLYGRKGGTEYGISNVLNTNGDREEFFSTDRPTDRQTEIWDYRSSCAGA